MRHTFIAIAAMGMLASSGDMHALEFPPGCPDATAIVTAISGINSTHARMIAKYTLPDALALCYGVSGRPGMSDYTRLDPSTADINACLVKFMREKKGAVKWANANCVDGSLTIGEGLGEDSLFFKFPIDEPTCAGDGDAAIKTFKILCPSYRGELEISGTK